MTFGVPATFGAESEIEASLVTVAPLTVSGV